MSESHYPECPLSDGRYIAYALRDNPPGCMCDRLRACEQRVAAETISRLDRWQQHSPLGRKTYEEGVQAARDAVAALRPIYFHGNRVGDCVKRADALAAIDAIPR